MESIDTKVVVMGIAAFIAFISLLLSLYSAHLTRINNRLSIRPKLTFYENWYNDDVVLGLTVKNNGHGVAVIKEMVIYWGDNEVLRTENEAWQNFLKFSLIDESKVFYQWFLQSDAIGAGEVLPLIFYKDKGDKEGINLLRSSIRGKLKIKIRYCSLHNIEYYDVFTSE